MTVTIVLNVHFDADVLADEAKRRGFALDVAQQSVIADLEASASDALRMRSGVLRVGSRSSALALAGNVSRCYEPPDVM